MAITEPAITPATVEIEGFGKVRIKFAIEKSPMLKPAANGISFGLTIQSPKNLGDNMSITAVKNAACQPPIFFAIKLAK